MAHFAMTENELKRRMDDLKTTQLERAVQGVIAKARDGDTPAFKYLIETICGRIPDMDPESPAEEMTPEQKLELMRQAVTMLESQLK